jgi:hypothetical protein
VHKWCLSMAAFGGIVLQNSKITFPKNFAARPSDHVFGDPMPCKALTKVAGWKSDQSCGPSSHDFRVRAPAPLENFIRTQKEFCNIFGGKAAAPLIRSRERQHQSAEPPSAIRMSVDRYRNSFRSSKSESPTEHNQRCETQQRSRHHVIAWRQLRAGDRDERLSEKWRKAAEDRHGNIVAQ